MSERKTQIEEFYRELLNSASDQDLDRCSDIFKPFRDLGFLREPQEHDLRTTVPASVLEAYDFYFDNVLRADFGSVWAFEVPIGAKSTWLIYSDTDGGDGWMETFEQGGTPISAAYHCWSDELWVIFWMPTDAVRGSVAGESGQLRERAIELQMQHTQQRGDSRE